MPRKNFQNPISNWPSFPSSSASATTQFSTAALVSDSSVIFRPGQSSDWNAWMKRVDFYQNGRAPTRDTSGGYFPPLFVTPNSTEKNSSRCLPDLYRWPPSSTEAKEAGKKSLIGEDERDEEKLEVEIKQEITVITVEDEVEDEEEQLEVEIKEEIIEITVEDSQLTDYPEDLFPCPFSPVITAVHGSWGITETETEGERSNSDNYSNSIEDESQSSISQSESSSVDCGATTPDLPTNSARASTVVPSSDLRWSKKIWACSICDFKGEFRSQLDRHLTSHKELGSLACIFCPFECSRLEKLSRHIKMVHETERSFKCKTCDYSAKSRWNLSRHELRHLDKSRISCPVKGCNYMTKEKWDLNKHVVKNHSSNRAVNCPFCSYSTHRHDFLIRHIKRNHSCPDEEQNVWYKCPFCPYKVMSVARITQHMLVHMKDGMSQTTAATSGNGDKN